MPRARLVLKDSKQTEVVDRLTVVKTQVNIFLLAVLTLTRCVFQISRLFVAVVQQQLAHPERRQMPRARAVFKDSKQTEVVENKTPLHIFLLAVITFPRCVLQISPLFVRLMFKQRHKFRAQEKVAVRLRILETWGLQMMVLAHRQVPPLLLRQVHPPLQQQDLRPLPLQVQ